MNDTKNNRLAEAKAVIQQSFQPLVLAMAQQKDDLEFFCAEKKLGAIDGIEIEIRPNKADAPRIYGRGRKVWSALSHIAESIGVNIKVPIRLGYMLEPIKHTEAGRYWLDRNGSEDVIQNLVEQLSVFLFAGEHPNVNVICNNGGRLDIGIHISPDSPHQLQSRWEAMEVVFKSICQPYGWLPSIQLHQTLPPSHRR